MLDNTFRFAWFNIPYNRLHMQLIGNTEVQIIVF
jgi:hypothetical protein